MKNTLIICLLTFSYLNLFSSCEKYKDENVEVAFEVPLSITPIKDTIKVGDTLTLEANFPDSVKEVNTGKYFKLENFDFKTSVSFLKLSSTDLYLPQQPGNTSSYSIINNIGSINELSETFGKISFLYNANSYHLNTVLIPKKTGTFSLFFFFRYPKETVILNFLNLGPSSVGGRKIAYLKGIYYTINNGNTNYNLLKKNSRLGSVENPTPVNIWDEQKATYTFVVK